MRMMRKQVARGLMCLAAGLTLSACTDDSYDLGKDIDMTMAIGSEGLQMKLGTTEKIMLGDLLEVDDEDMFGEDETGLFYLTMKKNTDFDFYVDPVVTKINEANLAPEVEVINIDRLGIGSLSVPQGEMQTFPGLHAYDKFDLNISEIDEAVQSIKVITPSGKTNRFSLYLQVVNRGSDFRFKKVENLKIVFPEFLKCHATSDSYTLSEGADGKTTVSFKNGVAASGTEEINLGTIGLDRIVLGDERDANDKGLAIKVVDGERVLDCSGDIDMHGDFALEAGSAFTMRSGHYTDIRLVVRLEGRPVENGKIPVDLDKVQGVFNPEVETPRIDPIVLGNELPDFLRSKEVRINVANPTLKFNVDMREIPMSLQFTGELEGEYASGGENPKPVQIKDGDNPIVLNKGKEQHIYFFDNGTPYDPDRTVTEEDGQYPIEGLAELVEELPERIYVRMNDVTVKPNELNTIRMDKQYSALVDYDVLLPFEVNQGMKIVYNDSITGMHEDLQDYEADGLVITADMASTIPLELLATIEPIGLDGKVIPSIKVENATVTPGNTDKENVTPITIRLTLADRADLKKLDLLRFKVTALAINEDSQAHRFISTQYLQVRNLRLKLAGSIVGDFN